MSNSFLNKLKKGMGLENQPAPRPKRKKPEPKIEPAITIKPIKMAILQQDLPKENEPKMERKNSLMENLGEPAGKLAIDIYQTENDLVIQSALAGVRPEDMEINLERDIMTIKGMRKKPFEEEGDYLTKECYWGQFAREIILPVEVDPERVDASMKEGILFIRIPKVLREKKRIIKVKF